MCLQMRGDFYRKGHDRTLKKSQGPLSILRDLLGWLHVHFASCRAQFILRENEASLGDTLAPMALLKDVHKDILVSFFSVFALRSPLLKLFLFFH